MRFAAARITDNTPSAGRKLLRWHTGRLPYDAVNDFTPVTLIDRLSNVLLVKTHKIVLK